MLAQWLVFETCNHFNLKLQMFLYTLKLTLIDLGTFKNLK